MLFIKEHIFLTQGLMGPQSRFSLEVTGSWRSCLQCWLPGSFQMGSLAHAKSKTNMKAGPLSQQIMTFKGSSRLMSQGASSAVGTVMKGPGKSQGCRKCLSQS